MGQFENSNWNWKKFSYFLTDEYKWFTVNSEGAGAAWDPLTLKTNTPKSPVKIKLHTEWKHLGKESKLIREIKLKEEKFYIKVGKRKSGNLNCHIFKQMTKTEKKSSQATKLEK